MCSDGAEGRGGGVMWTGGGEILTLPSMRPQRGWDAATGMRARGPAVAGCSSRRGVKGG